MTADARGDTAFSMLETTRLRLRRFRPGDVDAFVAYRSDPEVARYQSWRAPYPRVSAERLIAALAGEHPGQPGRWFQLAVALRRTDELIGDCALLLDGDEPRLARIGYSLAPAHHGRGYATEAVAHLLDYAFAHLGVHRVSATLDVDNTASARVLERLGWRREGRFEDCYFDEEAGWRSEYSYAVLAREWRIRGPRV